MDRHAMVMNALCSGGLDSARLKLKKTLVTTILRHDGVRVQVIHNEDGTETEERVEGRRLEDVTFLRGEAVDISKVEAEREVYSRAEDPRDTEQGFTEQVSARAGQGEPDLDTKACVDVVAKTKTDAAAARAGAAVVVKDLPDTEAIARVEAESQPECQNDLPFEIQIRSNWAALLDPEPPAPSLERIGDHEVWLLTLFSSGECERLLAAAEGHGFGKTSYPKAYRGNLRLTTTDLGFAAAVWARLQAQVPREVTLGRDGPLNSWDDEDTWDACGLNECWRLAKYHPGDRFKSHCDAFVIRGQNQEMSMFTVNVYMNEGFDGGSTRFYFGGDRKKPDFAVTPKTGLCLLFRQPPVRQYWHDGEQLGSGLKYLFRSDVMYRKR